LQLGRQIGGQAASAGGNVGQFLLSGGQNAARAIQGAAGQSGIGTALMNLGKSPEFGSGVAKGYEKYFGSNLNAPYNYQSGLQVGPVMPGQSQPYVFAD
jgi:hypothetical protein